MKSYEEYYSELMHAIFHSSKKKSNSTWATVFFVLFIINGISFYWAWFTFGGAGMESLLLIPLGLLFAIINFIVILLFIVIQKPQGMAEFISYTVLAIASLMLVFSGYAVILLYIS